MACGAAQEHAVGERAVGEPPVAQEPPALAAELEESPECEPTRCAGPLVHHDALDGNDRDDEDYDDYEAEIRAAVGSLVGEEVRLSDDRYGNEALKIVYVPEHGYFITVPSSQDAFVCPLLAGPSYEETDASSATAQWIAGGELETTVDFHHGDSGSEEGLASGYGWTSRSFFGIESGTMVAYGWVTTREHSTNAQWIGCHCAADEFPAHDDCCDDIQVDEVDIRWEITRHGPSGLRITRGDDGTTREVEVRALCGLPRE